MVDEESPIPDIALPLEWAPGVYANSSFVAVNPREVTLDFVRLDPWNANAGVVVARISLAFAAASDLAVNLAQQLQGWATAALSDSGKDGNGQTHQPPEGPGAEPSA
jgi:hypothetical protein